MEKTEVLKRILRILPDEQYIRLLYLVKFKKHLRLSAPKTFNEKLQWLKLHDRDPKYSHMVDKYDAKELVSRILGQEYVIPTYGVWDLFDDIDFDGLPNQFVLKCTHDSGGIVICTDKTDFDREAARKVIDPSMEKNYYWDYREWPYKNVKPRIIAEPYLKDAKTNDLRDYKFYTFDGKVKAFLIISGRNSKETKADYFDADLRHLDMEWGYPHSQTPPQFPEKLTEMIRLAETLSQGIKHLRVDFYEVDGQVYFGEMTFYDGGGFQPIVPECWDEVFGSWLSLTDMMEKK